MSTWSRRLRLLAAVAVFGVLVAGTAWGDDDHFPFGPFRMYASTQPRDGITAWFQIEALTADGEHIVLPGDAYGMRRAELEGRVPWYVADPSRLAGLADAYARRNPERPALREIELVEQRQRLDGGRPVGAPTATVVARWTTV